jgi:UDP-glucose 4-epimerase
MKVLITGGLGYIGSHTAVELIQAGYDVEIIDNFSNGRSETLRRIKDITGKEPRFFYTDLRRQSDLHKYFIHSRPDYIIHFAALKSVEESTQDSLTYYENNVGGLINLLKAIDAAKLELKRFVFSSSCTVYDRFAEMPVDETTSIASNPASPYGATKIMCEQILADWARNSKTEVDLLRYFNPAGAHHSGLLGEEQKIKRNLFPILMNSIASGDTITIYGDDYPTSDGTCVRDYIHVTDLALGHIAAMKHTRKPGGYIRRYNLGSGCGYSVKEIIHTCAKILGMEVKSVVGPRRDGDMPAIWADTENTSRILQWEVKYEIEDIIRTAWGWEKTLTENERKEDNIEHTIS